MNNRGQAMVDPWPIGTFVVLIVVMLVYSEIQKTFSDSIRPGADLCGCGFQFSIADGLFILGVGLLVAFGAVIATSWVRYRDTEVNKP